MMNWKDPEVGIIWLWHGVGSTIGVGVSVAGEETGVGWGVVVAGETRTVICCLLMLADN